MTWSRLNQLVRTRLFKSAFPYFKWQDYVKSLPWNCNQLLNKEAQQVSDPVQISPTPSKSSDKGLGFVYWCFNSLLKIPIPCLSKKRSETGFFAYWVWTHSEIHLVHAHLTRNLRPHSLVFGNLGLNPPLQTPQISNGAAEEGLQFWCPNSQTHMVNKKKMRTSNSVTAERVPNLSKQGSPIQIKQPPHRKQNEKKKIEFSSIKDVDTNPFHDIYLIG